MSETAAKARSVLTEAPATRRALILVAVIFLALFLLAPLGVVFAEAFQKGAGVLFEALQEPDALAAIELTLLIGSYAQRYFLGNARRPSLTETVAAFADYAPRYMPLPHPSPRNTAWFQRHPWFESELLPVLRKRVSSVLRLPARGAST